MMGREKQRIVLLQKTIQELDDEMLKPRIVNPILHVHMYIQSSVAVWVMCLCYIATVNHNASGSVPTKCDVYTEHKFCAY